MELKEARYILAIARHQSIGKAAESLYISQPSLSKYLKNLEERLGAPLFSRHENRYYPTYMGERYLHYAEQIVACGDAGIRRYCSPPAWPFKHRRADHDGQHTDRTNVGAVS